MPIGAQDPIVSHTGTGTVTVFAYDFAILAAADLKVKVAGVPVTTGFTVAGIGERDGGTVTFASPPAAAAEVLLYREITRDRATDYQYAGDLRDDVLDDDLDRVWMALQEDAELIERGVRVPLGESLEPLPDATARANTVLTFNAAGTPMPVDIATFIPDPEASPENIWLPSSAAMTPVVQAATLAEARTAMGVASLGANTFTGAQTLPGNAANPLEAVPKQQAETLAASARDPLASIAVTVASNAMTATIQPETLDFRSATLASGAPVTRSTASAASLTVPNGATLGTGNGRAARIVWGWLDNAGALEPFVVNLAGGVSIDESTLISTTAMSAASDSEGVFYSQTARTNVAFRVRGFCDITQATAGQWATAPTRVQGAGGLVLSALSSFGYGQSWQDVSASRTVGTTYYNTTGRPISVSVSALSAGTDSSASISVNGAVVIQQIVRGPYNQGAAVSAVVPPGASYSAGATAILASWFELR